jgi:hypothetical protein
MSQGGPIRPLPPSELGVGEGILRQYQTEKKFTAKMRHVHASIVSLIDI